MVEKDYIENVKKEIIQQLESSCRSAYGCKTNETFMLFIATTLAVELDRQLRCVGSPFKLKVIRKGEGET